ncbi:MAG: RNA methyltransferase [Verrucomicrobiota bacterium]|nr:RNA methyltransferase [Verrucomicrobiota bacterium]
MGGSEPTVPVPSPDLEITSFQNPRVKLARALRDRRDRDREGLFLVEGYRELLRAAEAQAPVQELFFCPDWFQGSNEGRLLARWRELGARLIQVPGPVFERMSYRDRPEGLLGLCAQKRMTLEDLPLSANPFLVVAEAIEKPGNLGTILRSADAAGLDGVIVADAKTDLFNPNVVRASIGTLFTVPAVQVASTVAQRFLRERKIRSFAATPFGKVRYTDTDLSGPVAIVMGSEQYGLSDLWMQGADMRLRIPMMGRADSLNVATATTLMLFEVVRQRGWEGVLPEGIF